MDITLELNIRARLACQKINRDDQMIMQSQYRKMENDIAVHTKQVAIDWISSEILFLQSLLDKEDLKNEHKLNQFENQSTEL